MCRVKQLCLRGGGENLKLMSGFLTPCKFLKNCYNGDMMYHVNKNNKKAGLPRRSAPRNDRAAFTLAEVLITLGIIGVVAALTLPNLIENHQKQVTASHLKKMYSIVKNAVNLAEIENGPKENWIFPTDSDAMAFYTNEILPKMNCVKVVNVNPGYLPNCYLPDGSLIQGYGARANGLIEMYFYPSAAKKYVSGKAKGISKRYRLYYSMVYSNNYESIQFGSDIKNTTRDNLLNNHTFKCNGSDPRACLYLIMIDGWEIKDDYPW